MTGKWNRVKDQILLTVLTNNYRIDSLNKTWPKPGLGTGPIVFNIVKNSLTRISMGRLHKSVEILEKIK